MDRLSLTVSHKLDILYRESLTTRHAQIILREDEIDGFIEIEDQLPELELD